MLMFFAIDVRYINPTYMIRSVKANAADNAYCTTLAHSAVHGSFAGYTNFMVGPIHSRNVQVPLALVFGKTNVVSIKDEVSLPPWTKYNFNGLGLA
jgi:6-phosphofructokinase 1